MKLSGMPTGSRDRGRPERATPEKESPDGRQERQEGQGQRAEAEESQTSESCKAEIARTAGPDSLSPEPAREETEGTWTATSFPLARSGCSGPASRTSDGPSKGAAFRCIVQEVTGRLFCTIEAQQHCVVPPADDFGVVRVSGMSANYATGERSPTVMHLYLPTQYGEWQRIRGHFGEGKEEEIVGYGEVQE